MPPKQNPLKAIRKQVAQDQRLRASALPGSGFHKLQTKNARRDGVRPPPAREEGTIASFQPQPQPKPKKVVKKKPTAKTRRALPVPAPAPPVIESWNPAGGVIMNEDGTTRSPPVSSLLGIAQIASWRKHAFIASVKGLISSIAEYVEITAETVDFGGEERVNIYVRFRSDLVAEAALENMQGTLLNGQKLQVKYA